MNKSNALVKSGFQMSLFEPMAAVGGKLATVVVTRENKSGAQSLGLATIKEMGKASGFKGVALGAFRRERQDDLKSWMARELGAIAVSGNWTGHGMRVNKTGNRLSFTFARCEGAPAMTEAEMCNRLGITVDQLHAAKTGTAVPVNVGQVKQLGQGALSV